MADIDPRELEALLETRRELGPTYDKELAESFAERVQYAITAQVKAATVDAYTHATHQEAERKRQLALGIVSIVAGIPITAVSAAIVDLPGLITAWTGIVGVNVAHAWQGRRR